MKKEIKELIEAADRLGYDWEWSGRHHLRFRHRETGGTVYAGSTPHRNGHSIKTTLGCLRRCADPNHPQSHPAPHQPKGST